MALCRCDCGKEKTFYLSNIIPKKKGRYTKSCGCKRKDIIKEKNSTHGLSNTDFYKRWRSMHDRMSEKYINSSSYKNIKVTKRWGKFENFRDDMYFSFLEIQKNNPNKVLSLERLDPRKDYFKGNCTWIPKEEQIHNRTVTTFTEYRGRKIALAKLARENGIKYATAFYRFKAGYSGEEIVNYALWQGNRRSVINTLPTQPTKKGV